MAISRSHVSLDDLPTELLEKVATNLDNASLRALHATSRSIKDKSFYVCSTKCFGVLKFCLHPFSLKALTDIANRMEFAKHVHTVSFGTEDFGLIDPLHEEFVKRNSAEHSQSARPAMSLGELKKIRERLDALTILQALAKFPKLKRVMLGHNLELDGQPIRPSWGRSKINTLKCMSGHCKTVHQCRTDGVTKWVKTVFDTVGIALEQLERKDVKISLAIGYRDRVHLMALPVGSAPLWYPSDTLHKRITGLQLHLPRLFSNATVQLLTNHLKPLTDHVNITDLVILYRSGGDNEASMAEMAPNSNTAGLWHPFQLRDITKLTLRGLCIDPAELGSAIRAPLLPLECVVMENCVLKWQPGTMVGSNPRWSHVIVDLQKMKGLAHVHFSHLRVGTYSLKHEKSYSRHPFDTFANPETSLKATWTTKEEVKNGLFYLYITEHITEPEYVPAP
jgi:hypothetical protein